MSDYIQEQGAVASSPSRREERKIIFASSLGTVFEWYDFFLYGALAAVISKQFFAGVNAGQCSSGMTSFSMAPWRR